ncbi:50S ribosomal protein L20 [candidate division WWE3 bacterium RIFCSPLOWO2_01_FULL_42_11]|uniref:Large ribosomal subunit protein bL20 n=1 Tax=candidate division WWE3 bacterium RIFCSPLOWO2_01_FULL_42_11 TaxID=1802627 RepID=A0A1F4VR92_UNCKA|nr:MAG: 50S ribosomal protein L20 [candidate division WWE3 bacterium RIFCSPLOWO2_01_FULL_42_11]
MSRTATGFTRRRRHNKILKATKGYYGARSKLYRTAKEAYIHAGEYAFAGRRLRRRDFRKLWIMRINAALKPHDISYSVFINNLKTAKINLNRKMLAEMALNDPIGFEEVVKKSTSK